ncbi:MAG: hypothetical protein R3D05_02800 [Dongiaceae bacterium]
MGNRTSCFLGLAALVLALIGLGAGSAARAEDAATKQLNNQLAGLLAVPPVGDERLAGNAQSNASDRVAPFDGGFDRAYTSWSFTGDDSDAEAAPSQPFLMDLPAETEEFTGDPESAAAPALTDVAPTEKSTGPRDFRIGDGVKIKAQPTGGAGGRVTLTFTLPN